MESYWRDYKAVRLQGIYYGTFFQDNLDLLDWVNSQRLLYPRDRFCNKADSLYLNSLLSARDVGVVEGCPLYYEKLLPLVCLGDGHDGVWNLFEEIGSTAIRQEILDWYHLKENLYKVGGSLKRLKAAETFLWQGQIESASALFADLKKKPAPNFIKYLKKHSQGIVNYEYLSQEGLCSIGSGAVESAVKQIGKRLKISGAQWKLSNVTRMLQLRSAYLNGQLST